MFVSFAAMLALLIAESRETNLSGNPVLVMDWLKKPSRLDVARAFPPGVAPASAGVFFNCGLAIERIPIDCRASKDSFNQNDFDAALSLRSKLQSPVALHGVVEAGSRISFFMTFQSASEIIGPPLFKTPDDPIRLKPGAWRKAPTLEDIASALPSEPSGVTDGLAECMVGEAGALTKCHFAATTIGPSCKIYREGHLRPCIEADLPRPPTDSKLLKLAAIVRAPPMDPGGSPSQGQTIRFSFSVRSLMQAPLLIAPPPPHP